MGKLYRHIFSDFDSEVELFQCIISNIPELSRHQINRAFKEGRMKLNGRAVHPAYVVKSNDTLQFDWRIVKHKIDLFPQNLPLEIIYEDTELLVVNKPQGQVCHPNLEYHSDTLVNALLWRFPDLPVAVGEEEQPGLVHRIDKDTSGLLVIAKNMSTMKDLSEQFYHHSIKRKYWALIWGVPNPPNGVVKVPLGRKDVGRRITVPQTKELGGKKSVTHYKLIEKLGYVSLVECTLETGRTHQIRAHLKYIGHPLFNDVLYDGRHAKFGPRNDVYQDFVYACFRSLKGHALHAKTLAFQHPITKKQMVFDSDLPNTLELLCEKWRDFIQNMHAYVNRI